ncbi:MAG: 6-phosphogluconate dehydrogenase [Cytophagales bacterium]|nr:MAG: 6-phosphogluconate dehydrogenase [Cytophagales bacterium]
MKIIKILLALMVVLAFAGLYIYYTASYSEGFRAGAMVKISKKGYIFKTVEGELNLGNYFNDKGSPSTSVWSFSVDAGNDSVVKKLEDAVLSGKRVKLHYNEMYTQFSWRGDTKYFVHKVE